jgi:prepilin-type N-terminal cleavage/methylation domain-containing protein
MRKLQAGDTIIEVMLAMSIIGIVLGAAFGIANRSVSVGQDAQERTEALKLAET